jgi:hypothetical protein
VTVIAQANLYYRLTVWELRQMPGLFLTPYDETPKGPAIDRCAPRYGFCLDHSPSAFWEKKKTVRDLSSWQLNGLSETEQI